MPNVHFRSEGESGYRLLGRSTSITAASVEPTVTPHMAEQVAELVMAMDGMRASVAEFSVTFTDRVHNIGADLYEAFTGRRWRPKKSARRTAKARKLAQRRTARAGGHVPGRDWRDDMPLWRRSTASIARGRPRRPAHPRSGPHLAVRADIAPWTAHNDGRQEEL